MPSSYLIIKLEGIFIFCPELCLRSKGFILSFAQIFWYYSSTGYPDNYRG